MHHFGHFGGYSQPFAVILAFLFVLVIIAVCRK